MCIDRYVLCCGENGVGSADDGSNPVTVMVMVEMLVIGLVC